MITINGDDYLDLEEAADLLKVSTTTVRIRTRAKEMPLPTKLKSLTYWKKSEIEEYIELSKKKGEKSGS